MKTSAILAALAATATLASSALGAVRTHTIDFFPDDARTNHIMSLSFDPRLAEPFLRGATVVQTRVYLDFTPEPGFNAANLSFGMAAPIPDTDGGVFLNAGADLGWTGGTQQTATFTSNAINGTIPEGGRGVWFWDVYAGPDLDPPAYSGTFGPTSRVEIDYMPVPQSLLSTGGFICQTSPSTFNVRTSCDGAATYQWEVLGGPAVTWTAIAEGANMVGPDLLVNATGASTDTLTVNRGTSSWIPGPDQTFFFRCTVTTTECGPITSNELNPNVSADAGAFAELGFPFETCAGGEAIIRVFHEGVEPFTYQWRKNGQLIDPMLNPTAATNELILNGLRNSDTGSYDALVTDACGVSTATPVEISICAADFNCDGTPNIDDIFIYLNAWFGADPRTDQDGNGVNIDDIFIFLNNWFAGCD